MAGNRKQNLLLIVTGWALFFQGCGEIERTEIGKAISPDGNWKAIIVKATTPFDNATTSTIHEVRIGENSASVQDTDVVLEIHSQAGLKVEWMDPERLVISFRDGVVRYYRNIWERIPVKRGDDYYSIDVVLIWKFGEEESQ